MTEQPKSPGEAPTRVDGFLAELEPDAPSRLFWLLCCASQRPLVVDETGTIHLGPRARGEQSPGSINPEEVHALLSRGLVVRMPADGTVRPKGSTEARQAVAVFVPNPYLGPSTRLRIVKHTLAAEVAEEFVVRMSSLMLDEALRESETESGSHPYACAVILHQCTHTVRPDEWGLMVRLLLASRIGTSKELAHELRALPAEHPDAMCGAFDAALRRELDRFEGGAR